MEKIKKILLAEDDPFLIDLYTHKLSSENFAVFSAINGREALEMIDANNPDLILLDISMPELTGWEVLEKIKLQERTKDIPVIMLSNHNERSDIDKAISMGASDYLEKACFTPQEVLEVVNKFIGEKK